MIPVNQTIENFEQGDCFRACVASILELKISSVPNFMALGPNRFNRAVEEYFKQFNLIPIDICYDKNNNFIENEVNRNEYVIATGISPRDETHLHSVVYYNGKIAHDPHSSKSGIVGDPRYYTFFIVKDISSYIRDKMSERFK